jgi:hypothetical protein
MADFNALALGAWNVDHAKFWHLNLPSREPWKDAIAGGLNVGAAAALLDSHRHVTLNMGSCQSELTSPTIAAFHLHCAICLHWTIRVEEA